MTDQTKTSPIDPALSVNHVLLRWPEAVGALNAFGVDTCCGGAASLSEAAADSGVSVSTLVEAIQSAVRDAARSAT